MSGSNQGKKKDEEDDGKENREDAEQKEVDRESLNAKVIEKVFIEMEKFNMIDTLKNVIASSTTIGIEECDYRVNGYGPNSWAPKISESVKPRFRILTIGEDRIPYVIREPLHQPKVTDVDSFINETYGIVTSQLSEAMVFFREPANMRMLNAQYAEPENIGIPYSALLETNIDVNMLQTALIRYLSPVRRRENFNFSDGYIFNGSHCVDAMRDFFDISQREMRQVSITIENEELRTRNNIPDTVRMPVHGNNVLYEVIVNPFQLNGLFSHLPRRMKFSSSLVTELQAFNFGFTVIDTSILQKSASISITRSTSINALFSISYTPDMSTACTAYMLSLINPGLIEFDIDISDIDPNDYPLRLMCALSAKILFARSATTRWNSVSRRGLREVEQAIMESALSSRAFTLNDPNNPNILRRITPVPEANLRNFAHLHTDETGLGWREGPQQRYAEHPADMPYRECARRQLYVHDIDDVSQLETDVRLLAFHNWSAASAASALLSAMARAGEDRSNYNGVAQVYKILSGRLFNFYAAINEYNKHNWYSALRLTDIDMNTLYADGTEEVCSVTMKGKTILFLMKALSEKTVHERRVPYLTQVRAECGMARDCVESASKQHVLEAIKHKLAIPENSFTRSDSLKFITPEKGPLSLHLDLVTKSGMASLCTEFYACVRNASMSQLMNAIADDVLNHLIEYGLLEAVHLSTRVANRSVAHLAEYTTRNIPYTNIGTFEGDEFARMPRHPIRLIDLGLFVNEFRVKQVLRDYSCSGVVELSLPIPYVITTNIIVGDLSDDIIQVTYDTGRRDNNVRHCIKWRAAVLNITDIDRNRLARPDLYVTNFSTIDRISIPNECGSKILRKAEEWLRDIGEEAVRCVYIRTDNIKIVSIFSRV